MQMIQADAQPQQTEQTTTTTSNLQFDEDDDFLFNPDSHAIQDGQDDDDLLKQLQMDLGLDDEDLGMDSFLGLGDMADLDDDNADLNFTSPKVATNNDDVIVESVVESKKQTTPVKPAQQPIVEENQPQQPEPEPSQPTPMDDLDDFLAFSPKPQDTQVEEPILEPELAAAPAVDEPVQNDVQNDDVDGGDGDDEPTSPTADGETPKVKKTKTVVKKVVKKVRVVKKAGAGGGDAAE
jgi:hypothetical protein